MGTQAFESKTWSQIGYGLYVLTTRDGGKDNGCIVNNVTQFASHPIIIALGVQKQSYTCEIIKKTGILNLNRLVDDTPFEVIKHFGYQSGRDTNKFKDCPLRRSENGLVVLQKYIKDFLSLAVESETDLGSHMLFLCRPTEGKLQSDAEIMSYSYYQKIKLKLQP